MKHLILILLAVCCVAVQANGQTVWSNQLSEDDFTGKKSPFSVGPSVKPDSPMDSPYDDVTSHIVLGCVDGDLAFYLFFSTPPNLIDGETKDGYDLHKIDVRFDDEISRATVYQSWGGQGLHTWAPSYDWWVRNIIASDQLKIRLNWYGEYPVFTYPLDGASESISFIQDRCGPSESSEPSGWRIVDFKDYAYAEKTFQDVVSNEQVSLQVGCNHSSAKSTFIRFKFDPESKIRDDAKSQISIAFDHEYGHKIKVGYNRADSFQYISVDQSMLGPKWDIIRKMVTADRMKVWFDPTIMLGYPLLGAETAIPLVLNKCGT